MKFSHLFFALIAICIVSCQTEKNDILETELDVKSVYNKTLQQTRFDIDPFNLDSLVDIQNMRSRMQWASYISAKVIMNNPFARSEVASLIDNKKVSLYDLIGIKSQAPIFKRAFRSEVRHYFGMLYFDDEFEEIMLARNDEDLPNEEMPPAGTTPCCPIGPLPVNAQVSLFLDLMAEDDMYELYLPNPLPQNQNLGMLFISSTGHPMTDDLSNYGYLRFAFEHEFQDGFIGTTHQEIIDIDYVKTRGIVTVVRPITGGKIKPEHYPASDFTSFLNID